jgi:hypothetical protein
LADRFKPFALGIRGRGITSPNLRGCIIPRRGTGKLEPAMEVVRLLTKQVEVLLVKYKTALSHTQTETWDRSRPERRIRRDGKVVDEFKRRCTDIDG